MSMIVMCGVPKPIEPGAGGGGGGNTITADSCSVAHVQAAIDTAIDGDTVVIPNSSCTWTSTVTVTGKAIRVKAETTGGVNLTNNAGGSPLFDLVESTAGHVRLSGIDFLAGTGTACTLRMSPTTSGRPIIVDQNTWTGNVNAMLWQTIRGLAFENTMDGQGSVVTFVQAKAEGLGLTSWEAASTMGTLDTTGEMNLYVEDNTLTNAGNQAFDSDGNARVVIRYNDLDSSAITSHGPDTGPYGNRHTEIYNNTFTFDAGDPPVTAMDYFIFMRGGVWLITDNAIPDLNSTYLGNKNETKMQIQNLRRNAGPMACWAGGYPMPRQIGWGHNGTIDLIDPVYIWGNTGTGLEESVSLENYTDTLPTECDPFNGDPAITTFVQLNRDYYVGSAKPSYSKYTYPHPIRAGLP